MARAGDKLLSESIGKNVSVFYNDTSNSVSFRVGKFIDFDERSIMLAGESKGEPILLPRDKCIRMEINTRMQYLEAKPNREGGRYAEAKAKQ